MLSCEHTIVVHKNLVIHIDILSFIGLISVFQGEIVLSREEEDFRFISLVLFFFVDVSRIENKEIV